MNVTLWGTRGSLPTPGPETTRYGGNTSCVEVRGRCGELLVLDAGTGIRRLGATIDPDVRRVDLLLTHLHMDHIEGLGFFAPLFRRELEIHIWGPASTTLDLRARLGRYLSPPIFPVRLRDLPCALELHDVVSEERFAIGGLEVCSALVCHPGPTVGFRISEGDAALAYLPDHEPALGSIDFPSDPAWMSGFDLAKDASLLIHDSQYVHYESAARSGARMRGGDDSFAVQAARILGQTPLPDFVVVLLGGNDICSRDCAQPGACGSPLFSDAEWREAIGLGLSPLVASLPEQATVYLGSVPRVQDLYAAGQAKEDVEDDVNCDAVWQTFDICRIATDTATRNGETQAQRLAAIGARQRRYNEILREEALAWDSNANGQNPRGVRVVAEYTDELGDSVGTLLFGANDVNGSDCFHPSLQGQNAIAERLWRNSPVR